MKEEKKVATAILFGRLCLIYNDISLTEDIIRSEMVSKLLAYILLHHDRVLTVRELSDMLWGEDGGSENPAGALKNLMYRLRTVMKKQFGDDVQFLHTSQGGYYWNPEIIVVLDTEELEKNAREARVAETLDEKLLGFEKVLALYQGSFLDNHSFEQWVVPISAYYHSMFINVSKDFAKICQKEKLYEGMERVCAKAIQFDNLDEELHQLMLEAMIGQNKQSQALQYYEDTVKRFYEALGTRNFPLLREVHEEILAMKKVSAAVTMEEISLDMQEGRPEGAYICGYAVFRELYRIEARRVGRLGMSEYIMYLTLTVREEASVNESMERYLVNRGMDRLEEILRGGLRIGDVAARYSDSQFLVLLPTCTYESSEMIAARIQEMFHAGGKNSKVELKYSIEEVAAKM
ncbi:MAG: winged helix-turn-helix domain-containing protein [Lachnospiraceae bacterium]|nr:winged helix-turn-helix domain-containing protein [Lachnospiraceae bacterium]